MVFPFLGKPITDPSITLSNSNRNCIKIREVSKEENTDLGIHIHIFSLKDIGNFYCNMTGIVGSRLGLLCPP